MLNFTINYGIQLILLVFLLITFLQSGLDKIFDYSGNVSFLKEHFKGTFIANSIPFFVAVLAVLEFTVALLVLMGVVEIYLHQTSLYGFLAALLAAKILLILLFGQRIAKDYEGARTITVYLIATVMALYFLKP